MKISKARILALLLVLLLPVVAMAEEAELFEAPVEEIECEIGMPAMGSGDVESEAVAPEAQPLASAPLDGDAQVILLTKKATKTVYLGVSYRVEVKDKMIKSCKSSSSKVATAAKDGLLTLKKKGTAKITVTTTDKKKIVLTLKVAEPPSPKNLAATVKNGAFTLTWTGAKAATEYLVEISDDNDTWTDYQTVPAETTSLDITAAATRTRYFRVTAMLGSAEGGTTEAVSILTPIKNVKVICEEVYLTGPTDHLNITWSPSVGATGYEVYRAKLPSQDYQLLGTTTNSYYPDVRDPLALYAYRVMPVYGSVRGNISDPVTLWSGLQDNVLPPASLTSSSGVILVVNKKAQVVTAYVRDASGAYTLPLRHMICSSGKVYDRTQNGTYKLKARKGEWYQYPSGVYIRYPSIYRDGYYFHSPLYSSGKKVMSSTVGKLGTRQSLGCVRLKVRDAKWIYENCPAGTAVYICDGGARDSLKKAIKPATVKVKGF